MFPVHDDEVDDAPEPKPIDDISDRASRDEAVSDIGESLPTLHVSDDAPDDRENQKTYADEDESPSREISSDAKGHTRIFVIREEEIVIDDPHDVLALESSPRPHLGDLIEAQRQKRKDDNKDKAFFQGVFRHVLMRGVDGGTIAKSWGVSNGV